MLAPSLALGEIWDELTIDISALKGYGRGALANLDLSEAQLGDNEKITVMLAEMDAGGNKSDLEDRDSKSDQLLKLMSFDQIGDAAKIIVSNATISSTSAYKHAPVINDIIDISAWGFTDAVDFSEHVTSLTVTQGALRSAPEGDWYVNFVFEIDKTPENGDTDGIFTFTLENIVARGVYNNMLKALDVVKSLDAEIPIDLITEDEDFELTEAWANLDPAEQHVFHDFGFPNKENTPEPEGVTLTEDAMLGLIGILVDEGTLYLGGVSV